MVDEIMYEMLDMCIGDHETQARPCAWDDINAPTRVIEYHTTCQDCGQRVVIREGSENAFKDVDGVKVTYCTECNSGKKIYDSLPSGAQEKVFVDDNVTQSNPDQALDLVLKYSFENAFQLREIDAYMTSILNNMEGVEEAPEPVVETVGDLVDDVLDESADKKDQNNQSEDDDLESLLEDFNKS